MMKLHLPAHCFVSESLELSIFLTPLWASDELGTVRGRSPARREYSVADIDRENLVMQTFYFSRRKPLEVTKG